MPTEKENMLMLYNLRSMDYINDDFFRRESQRYMESIRNRIFWTQPIYFKANYDNMGMSDKIGDEETLHYGHLFFLRECRKERKIAEIAEGLPKDSITWLEV